MKGFLRERKVFLARKIILTKKKETKQNSIINIFNSNIKKKTIKFTLKKIIHSTRDQH